MRFRGISTGADAEEAAGGAACDRLASLCRCCSCRAFSGIRTQIGLVSGAATWGLCAAIIAVACAGKFGGSVTAARLTGIGWRDSAALAVLMNTRGLVELVVLNIGLDLGVISATLFTMLVIMALVTTFMTSPLLQLLLRKNPWTPATGPPEGGHYGRSVRL
jgi:hypothetical protein